MKPICLWILLMDVTQGNHQANFDLNFQITFVFYELQWTFKFLYLSSVHSMQVKFPWGFRRFLTPPHPCYAHAMKYPCKTWSLFWDSVCLMSLVHSMLSQSMRSGSESWLLDCHLTWAAVSGLKSCLSLAEPNSWSVQPFHECEILHIYINIIQWYNVI